MSSDISPSFVANSIVADRCNNFMLLDTEPSQIEWVVAHCEHRLALDRVRNFV